MEISPVSPEVQEWLDHEEGLDKKLERWVQALWEGTKLRKNPKVLRQYGLIHLLGGTQSH